jgi:thiol-disulfide isomerase/thioredoxin
LILRCLVLVVSMLWAVLGARPPAASTDAGSEAGVGHDDGGPQRQVDARVPSRAAASPKLTTVTRRQLERALRPAVGRPLLLHVWASWCVPCRAEWPRLAAYLRQVADQRLDVVTLALDEPFQAAAVVRVLGEGGGVPGLCLLAAPEPSGPVLRALDPEWDGSLPTTLLFDAGGSIRLAQRGLTRLAALEDEVNRVVGAAPGARDETSETTTERWMP